MPFTFTKLAIPDIVAIAPGIFYDDRGYFAEDFKQSAFHEQGITANFIQYNRSFSKRDVLRGLHYQLKPAAQDKLIRVVSGEVYDVAVDLRAGSRHFGSWVSLTLSPGKNAMAFVPAGFAHGFCVVSEAAEVIYYCTAEYAPELERGIIWNDPDLAITWPVREPVLSKKDKTYPRFKDAEYNFT
jgi:dTDP-4-dehydrorhamnose 3,5-epimerase